MILIVNGLEYKVLFFHDSIPVQRSRINSITICILIGPEGQGCGVAYQSKLDRNRPQVGRKIAFGRALTDLGITDRQWRGVYWQAFRDELAAMKW